MPGLFVFLLKVNIALLLFCAGYYLVLRHLTFYTLNRIYLVAAILFASIYPQINLSDFLQHHQQIAKPVEAVAINWQQPATILVKPLTTPAYWNWIELAFWAGVILLALRLAMQLYSLSKLYRNSTAAHIQNHDVRLINTDSGPFSFWKSIYVNPANVKPADLKSILMHEQVHVNEWHTIDILIAELSTIFYWFNPGVWLMKKAIRENIEFITDRKIIKNGANTKQYQYSLISVSYAASPNTIFNHFNMSAIKKRIIMMNAERSSKFMLSRYIFLVPVVVAMLLVFSISKAAFIKKETPVKHSAAIASSLPVARIEKPIKKHSSFVGPVKKAIRADINVIADTQSTSNTITAREIIKLTNQSSLPNVSVSKNVAINISQNGEPAKPLLYIIDGNISKDYDQSKLDASVISSVDIRETADKKAIVYIKTKNWASTTPISSIKINGEQTNPVQYKFLNGKFAPLDTNKLLKFSDSLHFALRKPGKWKTLTVTTKFVAPLTLLKSGSQAKPELQYRVTDTVVRKPTGVVYFYGNTEKDYETANLKANSIEYNKPSNTIKGKAIGILIQKQNNETTTSTSSGFTGKL